MLPRLLETAPRPLSTSITAFAHSPADQLRQDRLDRQAGAGIFFDQHRKWATVPPDREPAIPLFNFRDSPQLIQERAGRGEAGSLVAGRVANLARPLPAQIAKERGQLLLGQLPGELSQQPNQKGDVGPGESRLEVGCQRVCVGWLPAAPADSVLPDETISLQGGELAPDRVVGDVQGTGHLLDGKAVAAEEGNQLPPRALIESAFPGLQIVLGWTRTPNLRAEATLTQ